MNTGPLAGKTAVVTAAGQGIGRAIAERLHADGAQVYASDLNGDAVADLDVAHASALDGTDRAAIQNYFAPIERVDILVSAVGYVHQGTILECSYEDWKRSLTISLDSAFHLLQAGIPKMQAHGGSVITISSVVSSVQGLPRRAAYGAAKAGIIGLTKSVARDFLPDGIRANAICPATVESPSLRERIAELTETLGSAEAAEQFFIDRQPTGRFGTPEEIAGLAAYLASDQSALITGQALSIDGGMTI